MNLEKPSTIEMSMAFTFIFSCLYNVPRGTFIMGCLTFTCEQCILINIHYELYYKCFMYNC